MKRKIKRILDNMGNEANELIFSDSKVPKNNLLEDYLERAGIEVRYFSDEELDGFLKWNKEEEKPIISVNANHPEVRRNFSMAHELGHLIIDYGWIPFSENKNFHTNNEILNVTTKYRGAKKYSEKEHKEETVVNEFAAAFLMPTKQIEAFINNHIDMNYQDVVVELAKEFDVSREAADIRISDFINEKN